MSAPDSGRRTVPADLVSLLDGLAVTVRHRLAPSADSEFLKAELYSLASILRILADEVPQLPSEEAADRDDLLALLAGHFVESDIVADQNADDLRAAAATLARRAEERERIHTFVQRDLGRGLVGFLGPGDCRAVAPRQRRTPDSSSVRPASVEVRDRLRLFLHGQGLGELDSVARSTEGYGAETVVCAVVRDGVRQQVVVRIQWPDLPIVGLIQTVDSQARAMDAARRANVPTPEVLATADEAVVGAPVLVTEYVDGYVPTGWTPDGRRFIEGLATSGIDSWTDTLIRIHAADIGPLRASALRLGDTNIPHQRERLARLESVYRASELRPDPLVEDVIVALGEGLADFGDPVLVHGDYRPGNIIYRDDDLTIAAVLDWDCAYVNDYHEDLGHIVAWPWRDDAGRVAGLVSREQFLDAYARRSGRDVDERGVRYYELQATFRRYLGFAGLARAWLDRGGDVRMARAWLALRNDRVELGKLVALC